MNKYATISIIVGILCIIAVVLFFIFRGGNAGNVKDSAITNPASW